MKEYLLFNAELFVRLVVAALCGAVIGFERMNRGKGAGIRTHLVVAMASALMMEISKYGFSDFSNIVMGNIAEIKLDPSRLAAQIVSGIGFLGAGMIYIHGRTPHGLTTAAGIWATSGIGMALGSGMYLLGFMATALIYISQWILHRDIRFLKCVKEERITLVVDNEDENVLKIERLLQENNIHINSVAYKRRDDLSVKLRLHLTVPQDFDDMQLMNMGRENKYIKEISSSTREYFGKL